MFAWRSIEEFDSDGCPSLFSNILNYKLRIVVIFSRLGIILQLLNKLTDFFLIKLLELTFHDEIEPNVSSGDGLTKESLLPEKGPDIFLKLESVDFLFLLFY